MTLEEIGQKLKSARDISGLSLAQIQEKTKIPYNHLASIDLGNFDDLPEPVYVSGFIRRYAECVGLDAQELVDEYRSELDIASIQPKKTGLLFKTHKTQKNNGNNLPAQASYYNRQRLEKSAPNLFKLVPFYALWIVLILVLIIYLVNRQGEIEQNQQDAGLLTLKQSASTIAPVKTPPSTSPVEVSPNQIADNNAIDQESTTPKDLYRVTVQAKNHVWVEVKAVSNGEALFNGFIETGDKHDFSDKEGLRITAINGSIAVLAFGKTSEYGAAGKTIEKIFSGNKVSQVAESQTSDHTGSAIITKTTAAVSSAPVQNTNSNKKPISETTVAKKPAITATPALKPHPVRENLSTHEVTAPSPEPSVQSPSNKAIDVPYRYSE